MNRLHILIAFCALTLAAFGQPFAVPTFTIGSNDVVQSSIKTLRPGGTNDNQVAVRFAFTAAGAQRLADFYHANGAHGLARWQCGDFWRPFTLENRQFFSGEGFFGLSEEDAQALMAGLRGAR